jgi:hypothetical protein
VHAVAALARDVDELHPAGPTVAQEGEPHDRIHVHRLPGRLAHRQHQLAIGVVVPLEVRTTDELDHPVRSPREDRGERDQLLGRSHVRGHWLAVLVDVHLELTRREADRAGVERVDEQRLHDADLVGGRVARPGVVAHGVSAERAVPDLERRVHAEGTLESAREVRQTTTSEGHPRGQGVG